MRSWKNEEKKRFAQQYFLFKRKYEPINRGSRLFASPKPARIDRRAGRWAKSKQYPKSVGFGEPTKAYSKWYEMMKQCI